MIVFTVESLLFRLIYINHNLIQSFQECRCSLICFIATYCRDIINTLADVLDSWEISRSFKITLWLVSLFFNMTWRKREGKNHLPSVLRWSFCTLTGVEWNDLFSIYFDLILKWGREAQALQHFDQIAKSRSLDQEFHMHIFPVHCSLSFGIYQFILPLLFWRTTIEWAGNRHGDQQRHTDKDRQSIVEAAPTERWPRHQSRPRATISHLDGCVRVNSGGKRRNRGTKAERETVRREEDSWQCVGGSLWLSFREACGWQQDLLPSVQLSDTIFKYASESPSLTPEGIPEIPTGFLILPSFPPY